MVFGLTAEGFVPKAYTDIRSDTAEKIKTDLGTNVRTDDRSVLGILTSIISERHADIWELLQAVYAAGFKRGASGQSLDDLADLVGISRLPATYSSVTLTLSGTPGTLVPEESRSKDAQGTKWVHAADATIGGGGTITVAASPLEAGPVQGLAGTITQIDTPIAGWSGVTNAADAEPGRARQVDAALRTFMAQSFRGNGGSSAETLLATILKRPGVIECHVIENREFYTVDTVPPHAYECVIRGGEDADLAQTIWAVGGGGIQTVGSTTVLVNDSQGKAQTVKFTRTSDVNVYIVCEVEPADDYPEDGDELIKAAILEHGQGLADGKDVIPWQFAQIIETPGIISLAIKVGTAPNPTSLVPLVISPRHRAAVEAGNISVERI